jgi:hypothetical protein
LPNFDLTGKPDTPTRGGIRKSLLTGEGKRVPQVARALCGNLPRNSSTTQDKKKTQKLKKTAERNPPQFLRNTSDTKNKDEKRQSIKLLI